MTPDLQPVLSRGPYIDIDDSHAEAQPTTSPIDGEEKITPYVAKAPDHPGEDSKADGAVVGKETNLGESEDLNEGIDMGETVDEIGDHAGIPHNLPPVTKEIEERWAELDALTSAATRAELLARAGRAPNVPLTLARYDVENDEELIRLSAETETAIYAQRDYMDTIVDHYDVSSLHDYEAFTANL